MTEMTHLYITLIAMAIAGGLGFYIGGRSLAGVKIDIDNAKNEIEKVKELVKSKKVTVVAPVGGTKATDTGTVTVTSRK